MTNSKEKKCCEKECLNHKYHCGYCNAPLTYSPQNFASRPEDIPNHCPNDCQGFYHSEKEAKDECKHSTFICKTNGKPCVCSKCGINYITPEAEKVSKFLDEKSIPELAEREVKKEWCGACGNTGFHSFQCPNYPNKKFGKSPQPEATPEREQGEEPLHISGEALLKCSMRTKELISNAVESAVAKAVEEQDEHIGNAYIIGKKEERQRIVELVEGMKIDKVFEREGNHYAGYNYEYAIGFNQAMEEVLKLIKDT